MAIKPATQYDVMPPKPRGTSIRAHLVTSVSVTMSSTEMDAILTLHEKVLASYHNDSFPLSEVEMQIMADLYAEVNALR